MTACVKCRAPNSADDAFCGSCGASLEFAAERRRRPRRRPRTRGRPGQRPRVDGSGEPAGVGSPLELKDAMDAQRVDIPPELGIVGATRLRITIADTWPARKTTASGTPARDVAISEIKVYGIPVTP